MRAFTPLAILLTTFALSACAGKSQSIEMSTGGPQATEPAQIQAIKGKTRTDTKSSVEESRPLTKAFFAKLQLLSQTETRGNCDAELRQSEDLIQAFDVELSPENSLALGSTPRHRAFFNVTIRAIGFDESRYRFTLVDGVPHDESPYGLQVSARPNNEIEILYLNEVIRFDPKTAPISTFTAIENRNGCDITHTVNVYSEDVGLYAVSTSEVE